ncbi:L,D-transpeptidase family protein [Streptomyces sp. ODS28]|uniref:L,D-transpeptidase family protein n=1 Tax=Streptomyces sp. ODS28 TaxID=3136688 RepID=UPI0031EA83F9
MNRSAGAGARTRSRAWRYGTSGVLAALALTTLPPSAAQASPHASTSRCKAGTGPYQRQLEAFLHRTVDGQQTAADCAAIRGFQRKHRISPADGYADLETYRTVELVKAGKNPNRAGKCPVRRFKVACMDMDRQLLWVQQGKKVIYGPVMTRTGREGQETRSGWHKIYWKHRKHVSSLYNNAPMPYAQFFNKGQALHGSPKGLYNGGGSAGCINLTVPDAKRLWGVLRVGDRLYVWGHKPGTQG